MSSDDSESNNREIYSKLCDKITTSVCLPPPRTRRRRLESLMLSEDDCDEIEIAPDGSRIYKAKSVKSYISSKSLGPGSRSSSRLGANSVYGGYQRIPSSYDGNHSVFGVSQPVFNRPQSVYGGNHSVYGSSRSVINQPQSLYGGKHSVYGGSQPVYNQPKGNFDTQSQYRWRHRDRSPTISVRSARNLDPDDTQSLQMHLHETLENVVYPLQEMIEQAQLRELQKRRRIQRDIGQDSEENTDESFQSGRFSTRSELPMRHRRLRPKNHPYARRKATYSINDRHISSSRYVSSSRIDTFAHNDFDDNPLFSSRVETDLRNFTCTAKTVTPRKNPPVQKDIPENYISAALGNTKQNESLLNDHVFAKPELQVAKKTSAKLKCSTRVSSNEVTSTMMIPPKAAIQSKRLSDVSEIPETGENTTQSFLKRKLYTPNLEMTKEKKVNEDSKSDSPAPEVTRQSYRRDLISRQSAASNQTGRSSVTSIASMHDLITNLIGPTTLNQTKANAEILMNTTANGRRVKGNKEIVQANKTLELALNKNFERINDSNVSVSLRSLVENKNKAQKGTEGSKNKKIYTPKAKINTPKQKKEAITKQKGNQVKVIHTPQPASVQQDITTLNRNNVQGKVIHTPVSKVNRAECESKTKKDTPKQSKPGKVLHTPVPNAKVINNDEKTCYDKPCTSQYMSRKCNSAKNYRSIDKVSAKNKAESVKEVKETNNTIEHAKKSERVQNVQNNQTKLNTGAVIASTKILNQESTQSSKLSSKEFVRQKKVLKTPHTQVNTVSSASKPGFLELSDSDDPEISFTFDKTSNADAPNLTNSSGENGLRRSARKSRKPTRFSDYTRLTPKGQCAGRVIWSGERGQKGEASRDNLKVPAAEQRKRQRSVSPTFTTSDMGSPRPTVLKGHLAKCADIEKAPRRSPRINSTLQYMEKTKALPRTRSVNEKSSQADKENRRPAKSFLHDSSVCVASVEAEVTPKNVRAVLTQSVHRIESKEVTQHKAPPPAQKQAAQGQMPRNSDFDSFLEDSSADEINMAKTKKPAVHHKTHTPAAKSRKSEKIDFDSFLEDSSADEINGSKNKNIVGQQKSSLARPLEKNGAPKQLNSSIASSKDRSAYTATSHRTVAKSSSVADLTANNAHEFKQPFNIAKAPIRRAKTSAVIQAGRAANNASVLANATNTSVRRTAKNSQLPNRILELLGPEFMMSDGEGDADLSVGQRANKVRSTRRPSPARSEMIRPSRSLVDRAARNFGEDSSRYEPSDTSYRPGYTHVTVGAHPRFYRGGHGANSSRFDDNASVASGPSVTSFRSLGNKYSTLHF